MYQNPRQKLNRVSPVPTVDLDVACSREKKPVAMLPSEVNQDFHWLSLTKNLS